MGNSLDNILIFGDTVEATLQALRDLLKACAFKDVFILSPGLGLLTDHDFQNLPFLVISPYAKRNYIDHTLTDQSSIMHFIEDNWHLSHIKHSMDRHSGTIENMFDFNKKQPSPKLFLDPNTGKVVS